MRVETMISMPASVRELRLVTYIANMDSEYLGGVTLEGDQVHHMGDVN